MANIKSSKKRILTSEKNRKINTSNKSMMKTFIKKVYFAISNGNKELALKNFRKMQKILDRVANKGLIHKNKASRYKSNLDKKINKMI